MPEAAQAIYEPRTVGEAVLWLRARFRDAGLPAAGLDARLLAAHACSVSQEETIGKDRLPLSPQMAARVKEAAARRLAGEPVSRIAGRREFWGLPFALTPHTLDPRPETELLVEAALRHVRETGRAGERLRILDLGAGSGCLLGALLTELPLATGAGVDINPRAALAARENLRALGLLPRSSFLCGDWLEALGDASFDIIVGNPPYIESSQIAELAIEEEPTIRISRSMAERMVSELTGPFWLKPSGCSEAMDFSLWRPARGRRAPCWISWPRRQKTVVLQPGF